MRCERSNIAPMVAAGPWLRALLVGCVITHAHAQAAPDPTTLSLEQLINVEVYSASKFNQKAADAPASVTVITRDDIRIHGYRSLAAIVRSVRGMYTYYDRVYEYAGVRGFARLGDFNSRLLLLIDGYRANDNIYDQAFIGSDSIIDVDLIERVEFVRGPSSSLFGGNAFFGVINVVTRRAADMPGAEIAASAGSHGTHDSRVTLARTLDNGMAMMISASGMRSRGPDNYYPDFDSAVTNNGLAKGVDYDRNRRIFGKIEAGGLTFTAGQVDRRKGIGNGFLGGDFNDPANFWNDAQTFVDGSYTTALTRATDLALRSSYGQYRFRGEQPYSGVMNTTLVEGRWWTNEARVTHALSKEQRVIAGVEHQQNLRQTMFTWDADPFLTYIDESRKSQRTGVFVQDEYAWTDDFSTTLGLRHDRLPSGEGVTSPRLAAVWRMGVATTLKAMYGTAFRAPNVNEAHGAIPNAQIANPGLRPEGIRSVDLVLEHYLSRDTRVVANAYRYQLRDLISQVTDEASGLQQFRNVDSVSARGLELEIEQVWRWGARLRASSAFQTNEDSNGQMLVNSPRRLHKAALSVPLGVARLRLGTDVQYMSRRNTPLADVGGYSVVNMNVSREAGRTGLSWSAGVYNLLGRRYADPTLDGVLVDRDRIGQDARTWRVTGEYRF